MRSETRTTVRSFRIIEEIKRQDGARSEQLAEELEITRSTIHRHLQTLIEQGYIIKEGEIYHIDLKFLNFGEYARSRKRAYILAEDTLYDLTDETEEECEFIVENDGRGILVYDTYHPKSNFQGAEGDNMKNPTHSTGTYFHLHSHAAGKAILAEFPKEYVETIVDQWGLPPKTDQTITTSDELWAELERIKERGVADTDEEFTTGLREVAKCVKNPNGTLLGAITIIGPTYRMQEPRFSEELPNLLKNHVSKLEKRIEKEYFKP